MIKKSNTAEGLEMFGLRLSGLELFDGYDRQSVDVLVEPQVVFVLCKETQVKFGEVDLTLTQLNELEVLVEEKAVGDADLAEGFRSRHFRSNASSTLSLRRLSDPVVPVGSRPLGHELLGPQVLGKHPTQTSEEVASIEQLRSRLVDDAAFAVVIPGGDAKQSRILLQNAQSSFKEA